MTPPGGIGPNRWTVFCDETGNSGGNYMDQAQPFYLVGGFMVPGDEETYTEAIEQCARSLRIEGELHGTHLLGRRGALKTINKLFGNLADQGCVPTFAFAEKKFSVAARVIETLLDPLFNDLVGNSFTYDNNLKRDLAERVYKLPYATLAHFAEAYISSNAELMPIIAESISTQLLLLDERDLSKLIRGSLKHIEDNMATEMQGNDGWPRRSAITINLPIAMLFFNILERLGRTTDARINVVHDNTSQFEEAFKKGFNLFANARSDTVVLGDGTEILLGFEYVTKLSFVDSKCSRWVQAADILVSVVGKCLRMIYADETMSADLRQLAEETLAWGLRSADETVSLLCSMTTARKILRTLHVEPREVAAGFGNH